MCGRKSTGGAGVEDAAQRSLAEGEKENRWNDEYYNILTCA